MIMKYHEFTAMNTSILFAAEGDAHWVEQGFREAEEKIHALECRFTRFSETSELAVLNQSAGIWFPASPEMFELVSLAYAGYQDTGGLFNPGILAALESVGYTRSMENIRGRVVPPASFISNFTGAAAHFHQVRFNKEMQEIYLPLGLRIDLGGIAKGWIAEQAASVIARYSHTCLVDAGGDLFMIGLPSQEKSWRVALEDPYDASRSLVVLTVGPGAVTTSTITKRYWRQNGKERHHLIDPRTSLPAQPAWVSVTAMTRHSAQAEVLAKALLIGGPPVARGLLERFPGAVYIAVDRNKKIWGSEESQKVYYADNLAAR
jgi:FAD:protein FMN transferase